MLSRTNIGLRRVPHALPLAFVLSGAIVIVACDSQSHPEGDRQTTPAARQAVSATALTALGRSLFFDSTLSASGRQSCASCHDPGHAWSSPNTLAVQVGGRTNALVGTRAVPTLGYAQDTPPFTEHYRENDGNDSEDLGPTGGLMWDGRAASLKEQAALPLLSPLEMGNANRAAVVERLRASPSAAALRQTLGDAILEDTTAAWEGVLAALDAFQQSPAEFYPYSSKYDAFLRGANELSARERRGLSLFNDPAKGNCASCHPSAMIRGAMPQFTDRGLIAIAVPRNASIPANSDSAYFDLGLCGPVRSDYANRADYCGLFKTPTLRNVAKKSVFFHNGVFTSLEQVLRFYAQRDVSPEKFYKTRDGRALSTFDDLPRAYWENVNRDAPFGGKRGSRAAFTDAEAADIIAFLRTLNDGYSVRRVK